MATFLKLAREDLHELDQRNTRRQVLGNAFALTGGALALLCMASPAQAKIAQSNAGYQTQPKGGQKCAGCALFKAPDSCNIVDGTISPDGWCRLYTPKAS
jgi:hypothetical protein